MGSSNHGTMKMSEEDESILKALAIPNGMAVAFAMKTALELDIFEHMAKAGQGAKLSASEIASYLPTQNSEAPTILDRILRLLASQSYIECNVQVDEDGGEKRLYSLAPVCKALVKNEDGVSLSPLLVLQLDRVFLEAWFHLKDTILEGGRPFNRAHGMHAFEYLARDSRFNDAFNKGMSNHSTITMKTTFEVYNGFEGLKEIIDVGGGLGTCIACIVSKYPNIKAINYDLPHVIEHAPIHPGVEHVAGDMFEYVQKAETIFMKKVQDLEILSVLHYLNKQAQYMQILQILKWILHDWSDEYCLKLLKNCWKALPETGKVIVLDSVLPEYPEGDIISTVNNVMDIGMMIVNPGGKERTLKEFQALAKEAGFSTFKPVCPVYNYWVIELYKN